jgi:hypothetical protein
LGDGAVGKTALRYAQYMALATGRPLLGDRVFVRCRVLILSFEDDREEVERRLLAARIHHNVGAEELDGWLFYCALSRKDGKIKVLDDKGRAVDGELVEQLVDVITANKIDLVGLDPFVKIHSVGENNNDAVDAVAQVLTDIAHEHDIAVDAPHHVSKGPADPGNAHKGRGASALVDAARLVYTVTPMSADEAMAFGTPEEDRHFYFRMDKAKVNITPPGRKATWFRLVSVPLGNGTELYPHGDNVQTVELWTPPDTWADLDTDLQNRILDEIDAGLPGGVRFSDAPAARERAAWRVVVIHAPNKTEAQAREIIKTWVKSRVLRKDTYDDPKRREPVDGLFVNPDKRPS